MTDTHTEPAREPVSPTQRIAANVRREAAGRRVRQTEIMTALELSESTVSRRMAGLSAWTAADMAALAELFGCPVSTLYGDE